MSDGDNRERPKWHTLKKKDVGLHLAWQGDWTNNLTAENVRVRVGPYCDIALDLGRHLVTRNKEENSYLDAKELADGDIQHLTLIQVSDDSVVEGVLERWRAATPPPEGWRLLLELGGSHWFAVQPDRQSTDMDLFLNVLSEIDNPDVP